MVFGIQFQELKEFKFPYTGLLWNQFGRDQYPACQEMPPIARIIEEFPAKPKSEEMIMFEQLNALPLPRIFLVNGEGDNLIQIQRDRFLQNWRKMKPESQYPSYTALYPEFEKAVSLFNNFLRNEKIGEVKLNQYELTYVNHIPLKIINNDISLIEKVFPDFRCLDRPHFLPKPERFFCRRTYQLPEKKGRLHVVLKQGQNVETGEEVFILDLTARGFGVQMKGWFDLAHEWIVRGFTDLTSSEIQKVIWERVK